MSNQYILISRFKNLDIILSKSNTVEYLLRNSKHLSLEYYKRSNFYIKNLRDKTENELWLSREFGPMLCKVGGENVQKVKKM